MRSWKTLLIGVIGIMTASQFDPLRIVIYVRLLDWRSQSKQLHSDCLARGDKRAKDLDRLHRYVDKMVKGLESEFSADAQEELPNV